MQPNTVFRPQWWLWPTILSLDAPAVALAWQDLMARESGVPVGAAERFVLASSVWLAYAADRWIEGWRLHPERVQTARHSFYQRFRWPVAAAWAAAIAADLGVSLAILPRREIAAGVMLLVPVAAYLLSHQLIHRTSRFRPPKEACVALLLGAGSVVFLYPKGGFATEASAIAVALFVLLCFTNCALISLWEQEVDLSHGQTSLAFQLGGAADMIRSLPWLGVALAAATWLLAGHAFRFVAACAGASFLLMRAVDAAEPRIGRVPARVLADAALLTPLAGIAWGGWR